MSSLSDSAMRVFRQTIAPGSIWHIWQCLDLDRSNITKVTIPKWQLSSLASRGDRVRVMTLNCMKYTEEKEEAETGVPHVDSDERSDHEVNASSLSGSGLGSRGVDQ